MTGKSESCCSCGSSCCQPEQKKKEIIIEFLYLDLSVCERCQNTDSSLDRAVEELSTVLKSAGETKGEYVLPDNLKTFFGGLNN